MSSLSTGVDVGSTYDFTEGEPKIVLYEGREVAIVRWKDRFYGLRNVCPHQAQSFHRGSVCEDLTSTLDGELQLGDAVLVCPWHNWPFDLATGQCSVDPYKRVRTFAIEVRGDRVLIAADQPRGNADG